MYEELHPAEAFFYVNTKKAFEETGFCGLVVLRWKKDGQKLLELALPYGMTEKGEPGFLFHNYPIFGNFTTGVSVPQLSGPLLDEIELLAGRVVSAVKETFRNGPEAKTEARYGWGKVYRYDFSTGKVSYAGLHPKAQSKELAPEQREEAVHAHV